MSTARTSIGCLAEDYPHEIATACRSHVELINRLEKEYLLPEDVIVTRDVCLSFVAAVERKK